MLHLWRRRHQLCLINFCLSSSDPRGSLALVRRQHRDDRHQRPLRPLALLQSIAAELDGKLAFVELFSVGQQVCMLFLRLDQISLNETCKLVQLNFVFVFYLHFTKYPNVWTNFREFARKYSRYHARWFDKLLWKTLRFIPDGSYNLQTKRDRKPLNFEYHWVSATLPQNTYYCHYYCLVGGSTL